jgi:hypothetical protein
MLFHVPNMQKLTHVPHEDTYRPLRHKLDLIDPEAFGRIHAELTQAFNEREIGTSTWIAGESWQDIFVDGPSAGFKMTSFRLPEPVWRDINWLPIYLAAEMDAEKAAMFFGQLVWQVVMDHPDCWSSGRYELGGIPIPGRTYFRIDCPD